MGSRERNVVITVLSCCSRNCCPSSTPLSSLSELLTLKFINKQRKGCIMIIALDIACHMRKPGGYTTGDRSPRVWSVSIDTVVPVASNSATFPPKILIENIVCTHEKFSKTQTQFLTDTIFSGMAGRGSAWVTITLSGSLVISRRSACGTTNHPKNRFTSMFAC